MNSLQRSSFSFRRQGSSGRIWQDQMQFMEPKNKTSSSRKNDNYIKEENVSQIEENSMGRRLHDNEVAPPIDSSSKTEHKVLRSFFSSIFGRCMSSPANRD
ncbi:hypothetical protein RJT34_27864 [Clitoria ternatea]|uniref:Uncharacterized protein n=1 Tax=Clitoria ternatea TaxID=43366 RepID=A0AAN9FGZ4_CLITE